MVNRARQAAEPAVLTCAQAIRALHAWLDAPGSSMPADLGNHVRTCCACLATASNWSHVELALQDLAGSIPVPPAPTAAALVARLRGPRTLPWYALPRDMVRLAAAGLAAAALIAALWWAAPFRGRPGRALDAIAVEAPTAHVQPARPGVDPGPASPR